MLDYAMECEKLSKDLCLCGRIGLTARIFNTCHLIPDDYLLQLLVLWPLKIPSLFESLAATSVLCSNVKMAEQVTA